MRASTAALRTAWVVVSRPAGRESGEARARRAPFASDGVVRGGGTGKTQSPDSCTPKMPAQPGRPCRMRPISTVEPKLAASATRLCRHVCPAPTGRRRRGSQAAPGQPTRTRRWGCGCCSAAPAQTAVPAAYPVRPEPTAPAVEAAAAAAALPAPRRACTAAPAPPQRPRRPRGAGFWGRYREHQPGLVGSLGRSGRGAPKRGDPGGVAGRLKNDGSLFESKNHHSHHNIGLGH